MYNLFMKCLDAFCRGCEAYAEAQRAAGIYPVVPNFDFFYRDDRGSSQPDRSKESEKRIISNRRIA